MGKKDPQVDAYIAKSAEFAKPILNHVRELIHKACPEVEETIKWGFPNFIYKGMLCNMASFKSHCSFGFWKAKLLFNEKESSAGGMGNFGKITGISDLPNEKVLINYIKKAAVLNENNIKTPFKKISKDKKETKVPDFFINELKKNKKAITVFDNFSNSHKKEYIEWITEAKTEETQKKRLETAVKWIADGKVRNWKYIKK